MYRNVNKRINSRLLTCHKRHEMQMMHAGISPSSLLSRHHTDRATVLPLPLGLRLPLIALPLAQVPAALVLVAVLGFALLFALDLDLGGALVLLYLALGLFSLLRARFSRIC